MSDCRHQNIEPYDYCSCSDCGKTCDEIIESMQARIEALEKAARALCTSIRGSGGINPDTAAASIKMLKVLEAEK